MEWSGRGVSPTYKVVETSESIQPEKNLASRTTHQLIAICWGRSHEAWSKGLTPKVFWDFADEILSASREEIDSTISRILDQTSISPGLASTSISNSSTLSSSTRIRSTRINLAFVVDKLGGLPSTTMSISVAATKVLPPSRSIDDESHPSDLVAKPGKAGYTSFFTNLEKTLELASKQIREENGDVAIYVRPSDSQSEANDLGIAIALILLGENFLALPFP